MDEVRRGRHWSWFGGIAVFLVLLYFLSAAPVASMLSQGWAPGWQVDLHARVYAPVSWLQATPVGTPLQRYWDMWNPPQPYVYY
jgi:hypothetical protein